MGSICEPPSLVLLMYLFLHHSSSENTAAVLLYLHTTRYAFRNVVSLLFAFPCNKNRSTSLSLHRLSFCITITICTILLLGSPAKITIYYHYPLISHSQSRIIFAPTTAPFYCIDPSLFYMEQENNTVTTVVMMADDIIFSPTFAPARKITTQTFNLLQLPLPPSAAAAAWAIDQHGRCKCIR